MQARKTKKKGAILLIGSTGHGKSTLGNFLIDPSDEHIITRQTFRTARTPHPETQNVSCVPVSFQGHELFLLDTPGLNESADLKHMIQVVKELRRQDAVLACILCVKFDSKIDNQYKETIAYYSTLLPVLFESNVIVVMTHYSSDKKSVMIREKMGISPATFRDEACRQIMESAHLEYKPTVFMMDCLPIGDPEERELAEVNREAIFGYILACNPVNTSRLLVAKPAAIREADAQLIGELNGEIKGYNLRLKQANVSASEVLSRLEDTEKAHSDVAAELQILNAELNVKDTAELVTTAEWSTSRTWEWFATLDEVYSLTSPCPYAVIQPWTNGHCTWNHTLQNATSVSGKLQGEWFRGLYASLALKAEKRVRYRDDIADLRMKKAVKQAELNSLESFIQEYHQQHEEYKEEMLLLQAFIEARKEDKEALVSPYMTLKEAEARVNALLEKGRGQ